MRNIVTQLNDHTLQITIDLKKILGRSKSKKTIMVASTDGNHKVTCTDGRVFYLGLNLYRYPEKGE